MTLSKGKKMKTGKLKTRLPNKPSEILMVALADLEAVENSPRYKINMSRWHSPTTEEVCTVCHAGAVMAKTVGINPLAYITPNNFDQKDNSKFHFINMIRMGRISDALWELYIGGAVKEDYRHKVGEFLQYKPEKTRGSGFRFDLPIGVQDFREGHQEDYKNYICSIIGLFKAMGI